jgi:nitroreductase
MNVKQTIGWRRSIRFFDAWREVEREKIQLILEAVYRAPRILDVDFLRIVVVHRDQLTPEQMQALKTPTTTAQLDMAPVCLHFYADVDAFRSAAETGDNIRELMHLGVLNASHGWNEQFLAGTVQPYLQKLWDDGDRAPVRFGGGNGDAMLVSREVLRNARTAIGIAQTYALLAAFDLGLGAQLSGVNTVAARDILGIPETWTPASPMLLGYHGESREAGGQRPREPFEEDFFEVRHGHPFYREPAVVESLEAAGMIQPGSPLPWRLTEVRALARKFGLPE